MQFNVDYESNSTKRDHFSVQLLYIEYVTAPSPQFSNLTNSRVLPDERRRVEFPAAFERRIQGFDGRADREFPQHQNLLAPQLSADRPVDGRAAGARFRPILLRRDRPEEAPGGRLRMRNPVGGDH